VCEASAVQQQASGRMKSVYLREKRSVACTYNSACACVLCVSGNSYLYRHIGDPDVIVSCNKILNHRQCRSNRPTRLFLSTASVFAFRLSGPKSLPCGSRSWRGIFLLSNITQDATKFYYVISQLGNKYAAEVEDVITNTPPTGRYDWIKAELIRRLSLSEEQRVRQLLMHDEMDDRRPTQFLRQPLDSRRPVCTIRLPPHPLDESSAAKYSGHHRHTSAGCLR